MRRWKAKNTMCKKWSWKLRTLGDDGASVAREGLLRGLESEWPSSWCCCFQATHKCVVRVTRARRWCNSNHTTSQVEIILLSYQDSVHTDKSHCSVRKASLSHKTLSDLILHADIRNVSGRRETATETNRSQISLIYFVTEKDCSSFFHTRAKTILEFWHWFLNESLPYFENRSTVFFFWLFSKRGHWSIFRFVWISNCSIWSEIWPFLILGAADTLPYITSEKSFLLKFLTSSCFFVPSAKL